MERSTILKLNQLNHSFYTTVAKDFDQTRQSAWAGWSELLHFLEDFNPQKPLRVLDIGCGNGRFLDFLAQNLPNHTIEYTGIDLNPELLALAHERTQKLSAKITTHWQRFDLVTTWLDETINEPPFDAEHDLIVVFGVMHHIPSAQQRLEWLNRFQECLTPDGLLVVTDWQFTRESARFADKTIPPEKLSFTAEDLEPNDYFLDWQQGEISYRYCHETTETERAEQNEALVDQNPEVKLVSEYDADGKSSRLNHYRVWHSKKP